MSLSIFLLIIGISYSKGEIFVRNSVTENDNKPINFKLTKLLDLKLDDADKSLKNDFRQYLQDIIEESSDEVIPLKLQLAVDSNEIKKKKSISVSESTKGCKPLVGLSKTTECIVLENDSPSKILPQSCKEILEKGHNISGIYEIQPKTSKKPFTVLCDMNTRGGGWIHIQKRFDGSEDFYKNWREYKFGFGNLNGEFWIGLENIYHTTAFETNELLVELTDREGKSAYAQYSVFSIGPEKDGYPITVLKGFAGDAGDALTYHLNKKFSTNDVDQDDSKTNCAINYLGAWWYGDCHYSNLNGKYINIPSSYGKKGLNWNGFKGHDYTLAGSRMLVRPIR